jgi:hypothetical protein
VNFDLTGGRKMRSNDVRVFSMVTAECSLPDNRRYRCLQNFFGTPCRILVRPFDYIVKAGQPAHPKTTTGEIMPQYLVCNYLPDDFDPSTVTEAMMEEIHALNRELIAAGARKFACGISPAANAKTVRKQRDGRVLVTDGPYTETKEHMGGFWILEAADLDEALGWAKKAAIACDVPGEVRELLFYPAPEQGPGESN